MTTTPKALPDLPEPELEDHEYEVWGQNVRANFFSADQMHAYAQQAIADSLASAGGVEDDPIANRFRSLIETIKTAHDESLDDEPRSCRAMLRDVVAEMEQALPELAALSKEREVADGLADLLAELRHVEFDDGADASDIVNLRLRIDAALTAHRESRGAASEAKEG